MKKFTVILFTMLLTVAAVAHPVGKETAARVAANVLQKAVVDVTPKTFTECYLFVAADGRGFVLLSADDCVPPVLGYSEENGFPVDSMGCNIAAWIDGYQQEIAYAKAYNLAPLAETAAEWREVLNGPMQTKDGEAVEPLLPTTWDQSPRYNRFCPFDSAANKRSVVGCVATATSQVMRYWQHPLQGRGSHSYETKKYGTLGINYDTSFYDWEHMPKALKASSTDEEINAVAKLCYEVGVSMNMNYGGSASGAYEQSGGLLKRFSAELALENHFSYNPAMYTAFKEGYTATEWKELMSKEIYAHRPIIYTGSSSDGGHAFVVDGINANGRFHINWGWGGEGDGYFRFGHLSVTVYGNTGVFNEMNNAVIGIYPITPNETTSTVAVCSADESRGTVYGSGTYPVDRDRLIIHAIAAPGYRFDHWASGSRVNPIFYYPTIDYRDTAYFVPLSPDTLGYCHDFVPNFDTLYSLAHCEWGIRVPAALLTAGKELRRVQNFIYTTADYQLRIYLGDRPTGTPVYEDTLALSSYGWRTIDLAQPVALDGTQDLWITFATDSVKYPAGITPETGNPDGSWILHNGVWEQMDTTDLGYFTWSIRGLVYDPNESITPVCDDYTVRVEGLMVTVVAEAPASLYDLQGRCLATSAGRGLRTAVPAPGVYVVRVGENARKIIVL